MNKQQGEMVKIKFLFAGLIMAIGHMALADEDIQSLQNEVEKQFNFLKEYRAKFWNTGDVIKSIAGAQQRLESAWQAAYNTNPTAENWANLMAANSASNKTIDKYHLRISKLRPQRSPQAPNTPAHSSIAQAQQSASTPPATSAATSERQTTGAPAVVPLSSGHPSTPSTSGGNKNQSKATSSSKPSSKPANKPAHKPANKPANKTK